MMILFTVCKYTLSMNTTIQLFLLIDVRNSACKICILYFMYVSGILWFLAYF